jgi:GDP-L-fucose synthase
MSVLVTGATGFLGTALCRALESRGIAVEQLSRRRCDLTDAGSLERVATGSYETIYHLAAWTQAGDFCLHHPGEQWIINQQINTNVLAWWAERQREAKLVFVGTSCAYAPASAHVESEYLWGQPVASLQTYALTKRMLYEGARALAMQYGLRYLGVVPSTLYGPGYHTDGRQMHFIFDLIRKIIRGREFGEPVVLWGDGHQRREVVHVDDFVRILLSLLTLAGNDLVNVGAGEDYSIREFAAAISAVVGYDPEHIRYDTTRYVGARAKQLDVGKLRALLPTQTLTPLDSGLRDTVAWFYASKAYL